MSMLLRPLSRIEKFYDASQTLNQFSLKVDDPRAIPRIVEILQGVLVGAVLSSTGTHFKLTGVSAAPVKIPEGLSLLESMDYMAVHHRPKLNEHLFVLGTNSDTLVSCGSHICTDGGFAHYCMRQIRHPDKFKPGAFRFPTSVEGLFEKQLTKYRQNIPHYFVDPQLTRFVPRRRVADTFFLCPYIYLSCGIEELRCYNSKTRKTDGVTEALWTGPILSASAFNNEISKAGVATCVDIRAWAGRPVDIDITCCYANVDVATKIDPGLTIRQVGEGMRADLKQKLKDGYQFAFFRTLERKPPPPDGIALELSNIGPVKIKSPVTDLWLRSTQPDALGEPLLSFSAFSVPSEHSNFWRANVRYQGAKLHRKEAEALAYGAFWAMKNLPAETTVRDAVKEIQKFQKQYLD
jgi:hypothetical protein